MASTKHNFIVSSLARKIRKYGFKVLYLDSKYQDIDSKKYEIPPKIVNHKPDIVGVKESMLFCIGEAKTSNDIFTERTRNQIQDFISLIRVNRQNMLFLGIPLKAKSDLTKLLLDLELNQDEQVNITYIPEGLFPDEEI
jgi:hypothetical protein